MYGGEKNNNLTNNTSTNNINSPDIINIDSSTQSVINIPSNNDIQVNNNIQKIDTNVQNIENNIMNSNSGSNTSIFDVPQKLEVTYSGDINKTSEEQKSSNDVKSLDSDIFAYETKKDDNSINDLSSNSFINSQVSKPVNKVTPNRMPPKNGVPVRPTIQRPAGVVGVRPISSPRNGGIGGKPLGPRPIAPVKPITPVKPVTPPPTRTIPTDPRQNPLFKNDSSVLKSSPLDDNINPLNKNDSSFNTETNPLNRNNDTFKTTIQESAIESNKLDFMNKNGGVLEKRLEDKTYEGNVNFIEAFIGPNHEKIMNNKFNIPMFFFNSFYMFYRRNVVLALCYILGCAITVGLALELLILKKIKLVHTIYFAVFLLIATFLIALFYNKFYCKKALKEVIKVKEKSPAKDTHSIRVRCAKKGGVKKYFVLFGVFFNASAIASIIVLIIMPFFRKTLTNVVVIEDEDTTDYVLFQSHLVNIRDAAANRWITDYIDIGEVEAYSDINNSVCGISIYENRNIEYRSKGKDNTEKNNKDKTEETKKDKTQSSLNNDDGLTRIATTTNKKNSKTTTNKKDTKKTDTKKTDDKKEEEEEEKEHVKTTEEMLDEIDYSISLDKKRYVTKFYATYKNYRIAYEGKNLESKKIKDEVYLLKKVDHEYCKKYLGKYCLKIYKKFVDNYIKNFIERQEKIKKGEYNFSLECKNGKPVKKDLN